MRKRGNEEKWVEFSKERNRNGTIRPRKKWRRKTKINKGPTEMGEKGMRRNRVEFRKKSNKNKTVRPRKKLRRGY